MSNAKKYNMKMEQKVKRYKKYKGLIKFLLVSCGLWSDYRKHSHSLKIFLIVCTALFTGLASTAMISFCVINYNRISTWTENLGLLLGILTIFLKVCIFAMHAKDLLHLNQSIGVRFEKDLQTPAFRSHLLAHYSIISSFFYITYYAVFVGIFMKRLVPIVVLVKYGKLVSVTPQLMPFTHQYGPIIHWLIYLFELINGYYIWCISVGVDSAFGFYILHLVGELRLLSLRFQSLIYSKNYKKYLKECVDIHNMLIESKETLQRIFSLPMIWFAIITAINLCFNIYQISKIENITATQRAIVLIYFSVLLLQAYAYSFFANIITTESEICIFSIYKARWSEFGDLRFMNNVLIIQSQKPLYFKAYGFLMVQIDLFSKIVNTAVSYFFILRTLDSNN